jgi:hypothetical protein
MRHQCSLFPCGLGRADLKVAIDGHGVATDNLSREAPCQRHRQRRFARRRRSEDDDQQRLRLGGGVHRERLSRSPGNEFAEADKGQQKNEEHDDQHADDAHAIVRQAPLLQNELALVGTKIVIGGHEMILRRP